MSRCRPERAGGGPGRAGCSLRTSPQSDFPAWPLAVAYTLDRNSCPRGVARALRILAGGGEIDYEGASSSMDWDANGDLRRGHIGIWRFTGDERIEEVGAVPFGQ